MKTRVFFATDLHSSEKTFLKFLNAAKYFKADALILGGDLTGKMLVPIVEESNGQYRTKFLGIENQIRDEKELEDMKQRIRNNGYYFSVMNGEELEALKRDPKELDELFEKTMLDVISKWMELAEGRLKGTSTTLYVTGGNDDPLSIDDLLNSL